jgi:hypothetical protein
MVDDEIPPLGVIPRDVLTADAGYHSEANLEQLATRQLDALIPDNEMRRRDDRFATQGHPPDAPDSLYDKSPEASRHDLSPGQTSFRDLCIRGWSVRLSRARVPSTTRFSTT